MGSNQTLAPTLSSDRSNVGLRAGKRTADVHDVAWGRRGGECGPNKGPSCRRARVAATPTRCRLGPYAMSPLRPLWVRYYAAVTWPNVWTGGEGRWPRGAARVGLGEQHDDLAAAGGAAFASAGRAGAREEAQARARTSCDELPPLDPDRGDGGRGEGVKEEQAEER
eukprot:COSAG06_NODE_7422_length_2510_cov_2.074243_2_plen_167_part_00